MIWVKINRPQFEYDIHSLVKAFYPSEEVKVLVDGPVEGMKGFAEEPIRETKPAGKDVESRDFSLCCPRITITLEDDRISCRLIDGESRQRDGAARMAAANSTPLAAGEEKAAVKSKLKQLLYQMLSSYTGKALPWGNLTGIRPAKIAYTLLEEGRTEEEILERMMGFYDVSWPKAKLSVEIANRERQILSRIHQENGYSLYVGIPFCPTTCLYCSFTSHPISLWKKRVEEYLTALEKEMDGVARLLKGRILDTVYIGGGTPTTLEPEELTRLLTALRQQFDFSTVQEFTVEAGRADSITRGKLQVLKDFGVNRISINPQTMKEDTLKIIGRQHTVDQVQEVFHLARELGFTNINMDLILGLPKETDEDVARTMDEILKLKPDSLTVHSLAIKRGSRLNRQLREEAAGGSLTDDPAQGAERKEKDGVSGEKSVEEAVAASIEAAMEIVDRAARKMDMKPYYLYRQKNMAGNLENVGYAAEGKYGIYNILIMEEKQSIAAIGAGTVSKIVHPNGRIERCDTVKDVELYIGRIEEMIERKKELFKDS